MVVFLEIFKFDIIFVRQNLEINMKKLFIVLFVIICMAGIGITSMTNIVTSDTIRIKVNTDEKLMNISLDENDNLWYTIYDTVTNKYYFNENVPNAKQDITIEN